MKVYHTEHSVPTHSKLRESVPRCTIGDSLHNLFYINYLSVPHGTWGEPVQGELMFPFTGKSYRGAVTHACIFRNLEKKKEEKLWDYTLLSLTGRGL